MMGAALAARFKKDGTGYVYLGEAFAGLTANLISFIAILLSAG